MERQLFEDIMSRLCHSRSASMAVAEESDALSGTANKCTFALLVTDPMVFCTGFTAPNLDAFQGQRKLSPRKLHRL